MADELINAPRGVKRMGVWVLNGVIYVVYVVLIQFMLGFLFGMLEGLGILPAGTVTTDETTALVMVLGTISLIVPLVMAYMARGTFYFSLNQANKTTE